MKTIEQIKEKSLEVFPIDKERSTNDLRYGYIKGCIQTQDDITNELKELCLYDSTAIGKQAECFLKVMPTLIETLNKHSLGVFLRGVVYRTYTQAQKDLLAEASEGHEEFFESTDRELADSWIEKNISEKSWVSSRLPLMKKIEELEKNLNDMDGIYLGLGAALEKRRDENEKLQKENEELIEALDYATRSSIDPRPIDSYMIKRLNEIRTKFNLDKNDKGAV